MGWGGQIFGQEEGGGQKKNPKKWPENNFFTMVQFSEKIGENILCPNFFDPKPIRAMRTKVFF